MIYIKQIVLCVLVTLLLSSCVKLPVYKSKNYIPPEPEEFSSLESLNFDEKTNINFIIANNDTNLYIQAIFRDRKSYTKIMRGGLTVFFDPGAKKGKDYQLKIERLEEQNIDLALMKQSMGTNFETSQNDIAAIIGATYNKVNWDKNGKEFVFYRNLIKTPIKVELGPNNLKELVLYIKIPLKEIPLESGQNLFSIGIESGSISKGNIGAQRSGEKGMSNGSGGMQGNRGGGGMGGHSGGGKRSGSNGGQRPSGGTPSSGSEAIKLWFKVQLIP